MRKIVAAFALITLAMFVAYAWHLFQQADRLGQRVSAAELQTEQLAEAVRRVQAQADQSLDAIEAAEVLERGTQDAAMAEAERTRQAEQDRISAEVALSRAQRTISESREATAQAVATVEVQRRERREEWRRLGSALRKIAPTETGARTHELALTALKSPLDQKSREILSRIAGALLANYGYTVSLTGTDAGLVYDYLIKAGVPTESIAERRTESDNRLIVEEIVLDHP